MLVVRMIKRLEAADEHRLNVLASDGRVAITYAHPVAKRAAADDLQDNIFDSHAQQAARSFWEESAAAR